MCCTPGTICFEMMKGIPAAFVTLMIGGIAGAITWRQYRVAQAKLKLDLFERRFKIFHQTWVVVSDTAIRGTQNDEHQGMFAPLNNFGPEAAFLFGKDIEQYIDEIGSKWLELHRIQKPSNPNAAQEAFREKELTDWFFEQGKSGVKARFSPYLDFSNWKG
jgi:hypothetical protein